MTLTNDTYLTVFILAIAAFTLAGLAVVPAIELANADSNIQLLQNSTEKNPNQKDGKCPKCMKSLIVILILINAFYIILLIFRW